MNRYEQLKEKLGEAAARQEMRRIAQFNKGKPRGGFKNNPEAARKAQALSVKSRKEKASQDASQTIQERKG